MNKFYIGTIDVGGELHLTFTTEQDDLISVLLISDAEHVDQDLHRLSNELKKPKYLPF
ncbi:hypothetical protein [Paenibacillus cremeus]|uniref:hypothetical protein n=1 Tax=Paenibacillus cremeus TaxID=2163881 RepID=UPI001648E721|nr:hypothetical protein [Paenibacillus cremeus]